MDQQAYDLVVIGGGPAGIGGADRVGAGGPPAFVGKKSAGGTPAPQFLASGRSDELHLPESDSVQGTFVFRLSRRGVVAISAIGLLMSTLIGIVAILELAVRLSNLTALVLLFGLGCWWGGVVGASLFRVGAGVTLVGLILVFITIALGG